MFIFNNNVITKFIKNITTKKKKSQYTWKYILLNFDEIIFTKERIDYWDSVYVAILKWLYKYSSFTKKTNIYNKEFVESVPKIMIMLLSFKQIKDWFIDSLKYKLNIVGLYKFYFYTYILNIMFVFKWIYVAFIISFIYFLVSLFYIQIEITKQFAIWYVTLVLYYLLMSTFNSFLIKYRYGKYTSSIQRFWKRTGIVFWMIEGFLFFLFFYYFLNSSQEPLFMQDYSNLNQEILLQLIVSYKNLILLSFCIFLTFNLILYINFLNYNQSIFILFIVSIIIFYMLYIESYQFIYIVTMFSENNWILEDEFEGLFWGLDFELSNIRVKQQYFILCLIAKYWHFIFIFISWFFFLIKSIESSKINYTLLGYNVQNLLILYILNLCCLVQWIKFVFKKFFEIIYSWFHIQYDEKFFFFFKTEIFNVIFSLNNFGNILFYFNNKVIFLNFYYSNSIDIWKYI